MKNLSLKLKNKWHLNRSLILMFDIQGIKRRGRCLHRPANGQMWASVPTNFFIPDLTRVKIVSKDVEKEKNIKGFETDEIFK